jgi:ABC-type bacteriocin/lantibiotic exporter with double-glycine peptidase domain
MSGCAGAQIQNPANRDKDEPARDHRMLRVPFFPDNTDQCGPSALASVITYWGKPVDPPALKKEIYLANLKGSLAIDLMLAAQDRGFKAHLYSGNIEDLKFELDRGHPLVVFINRGLKSVPIGHYVVITGYDDARQGFIMHSGTKENRFVSTRAFLKDWNKTQRSTLLILPPERDKESPHAES